MSEHDSANARRIFNQAIELAGPDRAALLDRACANDADLRDRVNRLLAAAEQSDEFLARPTAQGPSPAIVVPLREGPGTRIGPYKLLQQIGEGGFGVVFLAEQEQPIRRRVALKIIKLGMDTRAVIARFEAERQALAMMDHPNIARILDAGETETGRPYFVMELVKGVPITEYCDAARLSARQRLELFVPVCHAVQHAHHKGVIHRDLKPGNILVTLHDGVPVPKVIDFGIAKATDHRLTEKTLFTEHHAFVGTPAYMSPEQAEMSGLDVDTRTDVYSLGVLLYELLTGTTPFDGATLRRAGYAEMQRIIREVEPPKPSTRVSSLSVAAAPPSPAPGGGGGRVLEAGGGAGAPETTSLAHIAAHRATDPGKLGLLLRGDLDWIIMRCLEKDRTRRYDTAAGLAEDIGRHVGGEAVVAAPPGVGYRVRKFVRRNRKPVMAGSMVAVALLLGLFGTTWQWLKFQSLAAAAQSELASTFHSTQEQSEEIWGISQTLTDVDGVEQSGFRATRVPTHNGDLMFRTEVRGPKGQIPPGPQAITALGEAARDAINQLREEVNRSRRAEAAIRYTHWTAEMEEAVDAQSDERLQQAIVELRSVVATREELLGLDHLDTVKAAWMLATGLAWASSKNDPAPFDELAERLERAAAYPDSELAKEYLGMVLQHLDSLEYLDLDAASRWLGRLARALPHVADTEHIARVTDVYQHLSAKGFMDDGPKELTRQEIERYSRFLETFSRSQLLERLSMSSIVFPWGGDMGGVAREHDVAAPLRDRAEGLLVAHLLAHPDDAPVRTGLAALQMMRHASVEALDTAGRAASARAKAGIPESPVDAAVVAMALHAQRREVEAHAELERAKGILAAQVESRPYVRNMVRLAEDTVNPQATPEQRLTEEIKQRRLAEANAFYLTWRQRFDSEDLFHIDYDQAIREMRAALKAREEFLGIGDPATIDAILLLAWLGDEPREKQRRLAAVAALWESSPPTPTSRTLSVWAELALASGELHDFEEAARWYRRVGPELTVVAQREGWRTVVEMHSIHQVQDSISYDKPFADIARWSQRLTECDATLARQWACGDWVYYLKEYTDWFWATDNAQQRPEVLARCERELRIVVGLLKKMDGLSARAHRNIARAHYRLADYVVAREAFGRAGDVSGTSAGALPEDMAYLAMTYARLGEVGKANDTLDRLRESVARITWDAHGQSSEGSSRVACERLLAEAEALIGVPASKP